MLIYSVILIFVEFGGLLGAYKCPYRDRFGKVKYRQCDTGCCGTVNSSYCCNHKYLTEILFGSIVGFFLIIVFIVVIIHCCYRRRTRVKIEDIRATRNYGTITETTEDIEEDNSHREEVLQDDKPILPEVEITVTPASPQGNRHNPLH